MVGCEQIVFLIVEALEINLDRGFRERKISCPRLRKFRESSADSSSAPG